MVFLGIWWIFIVVNTGVYKILNLVNGKFYIGSTAWNFHRRWRIHRNHLRLNKHPNQHLQNSWNKYSEQNFQFEIIEECCPADCIAREQHYLDTLKPSYNISPTAGSPRGYRHTPASKILIGNAARGINNPAYSGEHTFYHPSHGYFTGSIVDFWSKFHMRKSLPYKLTQGVLSKSHGWVYIGKSTDKLPDNIEAFYQSRCYNDRPTYHFCHKDGATFDGTMSSFITAYRLDRSVISKLVRGKRHYAYGWNIKT